MLLPTIYIILGFIFLVWGADRLIDGAAALARNMGVSPLIVGLTVVGFGTSAPEMVVSAVASIQGSPGLAIGNAIGSNITNIALVLGLTGFIKPLQVHSQTLKREYPVLLGVTLVSLWVVQDHFLSVNDGLILFGGLFLTTGWMAYLGTRRGPKDPMAAEYAAEIPKDVSTRTAAIWITLGMIALPASSHILVLGASEIASQLGISDTVIGLTIVALGTSLPELAAGLTSVFKGEDDIAIGNIIGSNMFNLMGVLGIVGLISPAMIEPQTIERDFFTMVAMTVLLFFTAYGFRGPGRFTRLSGAFFLICFAGYVLWIYESELKYVFAG